MNAIATDNICRTVNSWQQRPAEEKFADLEALAVHCRDRADRSIGTLTNTRRIGVEVIDQENKRLAITVEGARVEPTHWAFGQLCTAASTPAAYLRHPKMDPRFAADALDYGLTHLNDREEQLLYVERNEGSLPTLRAMTSPKYGRILDAEMVETVQHVADPSAWQPKAHDYGSTTLYSGDRDTNIFLVDVKNDPIAFTDPRTGRESVISRGFVCRQSEVGARLYEQFMFWHNDLCDNRLLWQPVDMKSLHIRHTSGGPARFREEGAAMLEAFINADPGEAAATMKNALTMEVGRDKETVTDWLKNRRFKVKEANAAYDAAVREEGECTTLWHVVQGGTAIARNIQHQDNRIDVERRFGNLLQLAA